jgi:hypothetical protein
MQRKYGGVAPQEPLDQGEDIDFLNHTIEENLTNFSYAIMDAINGRTGRWVADYYVIEQGTCKMKVSANNNATNQRAMTNFSQNLQSKTQEINRDVASRVGVPVPIEILEVTDVTSEEARMMTQNPGFHASPGFDLEYLEEDLADWDSGIHKIIVFNLAP